MQSTVLVRNIVLENTSSVSPLPPNPHGGTPEMPEFPKRTPPPRLRRIGSILRVLKFEALSVLLIWETPNSRFLDSMKLPQSQRTTSTGAGFRICNLLELDNDKKQHAKKRKSSSSLDDSVTLHRSRDQEAEEADDEEDTACPDGSLTRRSGTTLSQEDTSSNPDLHGCSVINSDDDSRPEVRGVDGARGTNGSAASRGQDERTSPSAASGDEGGGKPSFALRATSLAEDLHARFGYSALHPGSHLAHLPSHPHPHHHHHHHQHNHQHHPTHLHHPHHTLASTPPGHALFGGRSWPYDSCNTLNGK
uniref:Uncharacterized protein n=1 Tax=Anopheles minimus TaxID=112268 RepID=A0A182W264_9DIPT